MNLAYKSNCCPHCNEMNYDAGATDWSIEGVVATDCFCNSCSKRFTNFYTLSEVQYYTNEEDGDNGKNKKTLILSLTEKEKQTILKAIELLIDQEEDTISHEVIVHKLLGHMIRNISEEDEENSCCCGNNLDIEESKFCSECL